LPDDEHQEVPESELIRVRREKLARIIELGFDPYPTKADVDHSIPEVVAKYGGKFGLNGVFGGRESAVLPIANLPGCAECRRAFSASERLRPIAAVLRDDFRDAVIDVGFGRIGSNPSSMMRASFSRRTRISSDSGLLGARRLAKRREFYSGGFGGGGCCAGFVSGADGVTIAVAGACGDGAGSAIACTYPGGVGWNVVLSRACSFG